MRAAWDRPRHIALPFPPSYHAVSSPHTEGEGCEGCSRPSASAPLTPPTHRSAVVARPCARLHHGPELSTGGRRQLRHRARGAALQETPNLLFSGHLVQRWRRTSLFTAAQPCRSGIGPSFIPGLGVPRPHLLTGDQPRSSLQSAPALTQPTKISILHSTPTSPFAAMQLHPTHARTLPQSYSQGRRRSPAFRLRGSMRIKQKSRENTR